MMMIAALVAQAADPAFEAAVAARTSGRAAEAVAAFEALSKSRPADADVWLNLGLSYSDARRYVEAEQALRTALTLAPAYADARLAYARVAYFQGDNAEARARLAPLLATSPVNPEVEAFAAQLARAETRAPALRVDAVYSRSRLTQGLSDWTSILLSVGKRVDPDVTFVGSVEHTERFALPDTYFEGLIYRRLGDADGYLGLGGAPDADYRAELALRAGLEGTVATRGAWRLNLGADAGWHRYGVGDVRTVQPYARLAYDRFAVTVRSINTLDELDDYQSGYALRADLEATSRLRFTAGYASAPETSEGRTVKVNVSSLGVAFDPTPATTLSLSVAHDERDSYDRDDLSVGLTRRF